MKTVEEPSLKADPVIVEVRRAKLALAEKYDFNVKAMVQALRERDQQDNAETVPHDPAPAPDPESTLE